MVFILWKRNQQYDDNEPGEKEREEAKNTDDSLTIDHSMHHWRFIEKRTTGKVSNKAMKNCPAQSFMTHGQNSEASSKKRNDN